MSEYVSKDEVLKITCDECPFRGCHGPCRVYEKIAKLPAANVRPVVRGHWIGTKEAEEMGDIMKEFTCSVCGCCEWDCTESESFNFCPNCGADMRQT